jgi:cytidylate kinase
MAVITISRQFASNGDEIARAAAKRLGHPLLDKHTIEHQLEEHGIDAGDINRYDEKRPGIWAALSVDRDRYDHFLRLAVLEVARTGNAVILGRGAHSILKGIPDIATIRVVAPYALRHARVVEHFGASDSQADRMIHHNDRDREGFHRSFHGVEWDAPDQYVVTINTGFMDVTTAVDIVCAVHDHMQSLADRDRTRALISNRWLATRVAADIRFSASLAVRYLDVHAVDGTVTLNGVVTSAVVGDRCVEIAREAPGVKEVVSNLQEVPEYAPPMI